MNEDFDSIKKLVLLWEIKNLYQKTAGKQLDYISTYSSLGHTNAEILLKELSKDDYFVLETTEVEEISVDKPEMYVERHWKITIQDNFQTEYENYIKAFPVNKPLIFDTLKLTVLNAIMAERRLSKDFIVLSSKRLSEEENNIDLFFVIFYLENNGFLKIEKIEDTSKYEKIGNSKYRLYDLSFTVVLLGEPNVSGKRTEYRFINGKGSIKLISHEDTITKELVGNILINGKPIISGGAEKVRKNALRLLHELIKANGDLVKRNTLFGARFKEDVYDPTPSSLNSLHKAVTSLRKAGVTNIKAIKEKGYYLEK
jgi:hypothetical protein